LCTDINTKCRILLATAVEIVLSCITLHYADYAGFLGVELAKRYQNPAVMGLIGTSTNKM
jgi:hypothetical protein